MAKTTFEVDDLTKAFLAGAQFGGEMVLENIRRKAKNKPELTEPETTDATMKQLQALLESLGYEAPKK